MRYKNARGTWPETTFCMAVTSGLPITQTILQQAAVYAIEGVRGRNPGHWLYRISLTVLRLRLTIAVRWLHLSIWQLFRFIFRVAIMWFMRIPTKLMANRHYSDTLFITMKAYYLRCNSQTPLQPNRYHVTILTVNHKVEYQITLIASQSLVVKHSLFILSASWVQVI